MALMKLQATKPFRYGTRALVAGDFFEARDRDARVLLAVRKARTVREPADVPPPPPEIAKKIEAAVAPAAPGALGGASEVGALKAGDLAQPGDMGAVRLAVVRSDYERIVGKKPFHGWDVATLLAKITEAGKPS